MVGSRDVFYSRPAFASFLPAAILTCRVKHSTFEATGEMDKEERKIINKGQEDEMVTSFHDFLGSKKMQLKKKLRKAARAGVRPSGGVFVQLMRL